jgi:quercetin dioxygenase-like cupin family protein
VRANTAPVSDHAIGDLAEVLDNLGVFRSHPSELAELCPTGFRRVPISSRGDSYLSLQCFAPNQVAYAHTHPDSEEWVVVLAGSGEAKFGPTPVPLGPGVVVGRGAAFPHGFVSGDEPMSLLSIQLPRPVEGATTWDEAGETTEPRRCDSTTWCRRCARCGGHSAVGPTGAWRCENCSFQFP